jgi:hypothetical protein
MRNMRTRRKAAGYRSESRWVSEPDAVSYSSHRLLDARSLAMHALIAEKMVRDPRLLEHARRTLRRWKERQSGPAPAWMNEWGSILRRPLMEVAAFITEISERAARLRQSSPFAGVLSMQERKRLYEAFRP